MGNRPLSQIQLHTKLLHQPSSAESSAYFGSHLWSTHMVEASRPFRGSTFHLHYATILGGHEDKLQIEALVSASSHVCTETPSQQGKGLLNIPIN